MEIRMQYAKVVNDSSVFGREWPILKEHDWSFSRGNGLISWIYVKPGCSKNGIEGVDFLATESQVLDLLPMRGRTREEFELHGDGSGERLPFTACDERAGRTGRARTAKASAIDEELKREAALKQEKKRKREEEIAKEKKTMAAKKKKKSKNKRESSPKMTPPDVKKTKPQSPGGCLSSSSEESEEEENPFDWDVLWPRLASCGWRINKAPGPNPGYRDIYVRPKRSKKGDAGVDYFTSKEEVIKFQKTEDQVRVCLVRSASSLRMGAHWISTPIADTLNFFAVSNIIPAPSFVTGFARRRNCAEAANRARRPCSPTP